MILPKGLSKEEAQKIAMESDGVKSRLDGKTILKIIVIPDRLINLVVKE